MGEVLKCQVAVVGGGPAGLMAAQTLSEAGVSVHVFDAMPSVGRKFLLAGVGGLNLTHAEALPVFVTRFRGRAQDCGRWFDVWGPNEVRAWAAGLGVQTFVGTSQRVFPTDMKAAPLLRAWLHRLRHPLLGAPVLVHTRHRWQGTLRERVSGASSSWELGFETPRGALTVVADRVVLALGGGSWPKLGSDGAWQAPVASWGVPVLPLVPANCGFDVAVRGRLGWSEHLVSRGAGQPLKGVVLRCASTGGGVFERRGECVVTATGIEGSLVYAAAADLRDRIAQVGAAEVRLDFKPDWSDERVLGAVSRRPKGRSLSSHLKGALGLTPVQVALLYEVLDTADLQNPVRLAAAVKALPLALVAARPLAEAISSAGGVALEALTGDLMARARPGVFMAGEMLDWEAPTGGYLLTACLASGRVAGLGVLRHLGLPTPGA